MATEVEIAEEEGPDLLTNFGRVDIAVLTDHPVRVPTEPKYSTGL